MKSVILLLALSMAWGADNRLTDAERAAGWRLLFDGATTEGWLEITGKPFPSNCWTVEDGSLKALVRTDGFQDIRTKDTFASFDLEFDWKMLKDGNSGVKYFIAKVDEWTNQEGRQARARGLEYQLADDSNADAASDPRRVAGSLYSLIAPAPRIPPRIGEFNHSRLLVNGHHVEHWLNGIKTVEFDAGNADVLKQLGGTLPETSPISLQNHSSETWFRNIKIRPLR
jgi:3-keto-disaccharide hydrolase